MSDLDFLKELESEYLQEKWDRFLIECWKTKPNIYVANLVKIFCAKEKVSLIKVLPLKRVPKHKKQEFNTVTRYIAAYMPLLNTHLWNNNKTEDELVSICSKITLLDWPCDSIAKDKEIRKASRDYKKNVTEYLGAKDFYRKSNRSNWEAAK
jgi:hypothetical protein